MRSLLSGERGLEVVGEATNGAEALVVCRQLQPDLVLMDVRMPDVDGLAATRAIKRETPTTSVILVTVYENPDYLVEALKAGAAGYLLKGAPKREIVSTVRQVLAGESLLHPDLVLAMLKQLSAVTGDSGAMLRLPPRERDVLRLIALGLSNKEIAAAWS